MVKSLLLLQLDGASGLRAVNQTASQQGRRRTRRMRTSIGPAGARHDDMPEDDGGGALACAVGR